MSFTEFPLMARMHTKVCVPFVMVTAVKYYEEKNKKMFSLFSMS
ncbi:hypothetical protein MTBPR1_30036 [Candidatus Terasakiella magnetica]|uniref:Uncharacterized protein n=1 Tax=Candidatus Terasakiella magnetica TaxID=1867952 RepID=A0A1C3RHA9_9PROT|nr:hypothetical protein MTBPR1_30036 [Candidatus Terasakiella magnetica]